MRKAVLLVAILLVGSALPVATARHLSAGYEDAPGTGVTETPDDPTVRGDTDNVGSGDGDDGDEPYERGLGIGCNVYDPKAEVSQEEASRAATADGLCGELVYHPDEPELRQESPPDQEILLDDTIQAFDVQIIDYAGTALEDWCLTFCPGRPASDAQWDAVHTLGSAAGLTPTTDEANSQESEDRDQIYYAAVNLPTAARTVQDNFGAWEMNGPYPHEPYQAFVGYLEGFNGPIGEDEIQSILDARGLTGTNDPHVCGFSPEVEFAATAAIGSCEITLQYQDPGSGGTTFDDGYNDECESPTYVCGATAGGAWYGRIQCPTYCGSLSETSYEVWHWVAGPSLDETCDAREPGFAFTPGDTATNGLPWLAHDLDVYSPSATVVDQGRSVPTTDAYVDEVTGSATDAADSVVDQVTDQVPGLEELPDTSGAVAQVSKDDRVEPNADPVGGLSDTSQSIDDADLQRSLDACSSLTSSESPDTVDPWVDIVDGTTELGVNSQRTGTGQEAQVPFYTGAGVSADEFQDAVGFTEGLVGADVTNDDLGLYQNSDENQDSSNRDGPATVWTRGKVGMFTDKDDDGEYDQNFFGNKWQGSEITEDGAFPMIWDVWVDGDGNIDPNSGCTRTGGESISEIAIDAGFGGQTGLVQLVYLEEPTVFFDPATRETTAFPAGNNIYLLGSQSVKQLWDPDQDTGDPIDVRVDAAIADLASYADDNNGDLPRPTVQTPGSELGKASDFQAQCEEPSGGFSSALSFVHQCESGCAADTIVTRYVFELEDGTVGSGATLPTFDIPGTETSYDFGSGTHAWTDVDPFDGAPDRNTDDSSAPPTGDD